MPMKLNERIRAARKARGLTQYDVADRLTEAGFASSTQGEVSAWERGVDKKLFLAYIRKAMALARTLDVPLDWLADELDPRGVADARKGVDVTGQERTLLAVARQMGVERALDVLGQHVPLGPATFQGPPVVEDRPSDGPGSGRGRRKRQRG